jgi:type II secretory pathway pseudopilin PulG
MTWMAIKAALRGLSGFMLKHWRVVLILIVAAAVFGLWQHSRNQAADIKKLKGNITLLETVVTEYENAARELEGKAIYEKDNANIAAESAAAVAAGRKNGDGPMAPVLRAEYERVQRLAKDRRGNAR